MIVDFLRILFLVPCVLAEWIRHLLYRPSERPLCPPSRPSCHQQRTRCILGRLFLGFPLAVNREGFVLWNRGLSFLWRENTKSLNMQCIAHANRTKQRNSYLSKGLALSRISECNKTISEARENLQERISRSTSASKFEFLFVPSVFT